MALSLFQAPLGFDAEGRGGLGEELFVVEEGIGHGGDCLVFYLL